MALSLHTGFVIFHLVGVVLGFGAAATADILILRRAVFRPVSASLIEMVEFISKLVTFGLALVWVSGIGLALEVWLRNPAFATNAKFWAKVMIVAVLSLNALIIHGFVLARLRKQAGARLFQHLGFSDQLIFIAAASISGVSWYLPLVLGPAREWSYVMPLSTLLLLYVFLLSAAAFIITCLAWWSLGAARGPAAAGDQARAT